MEWYVIKNSNGDDIGKKFPQTDGMKSGYNLNKENSVWNLQRGEFPDFEPDLDYFVLHNSAKLTDVISVGSLITATGFLVNDKVKNIFDQFQLPMHKYYPAKVMHKKILYDNYYWLHFGEDNSNSIDFKKSSFELKHPLPFFQDEIISISDMEKAEIEILKKEKTKVSLFPLIITLENEIDLDLLIFSVFWEKIFISSKLNAILYNNKVTGLEIKPAMTTVT